MFHGASLTLSSDMDQDTLCLVHILKLNLTHILQSIYYITLSTLRTTCGTGKMDGKVLNDHKDSVIFIPETYWATSSTICSNVIKNSIYGI